MMKQQIFQQRRQQFLAQLPPNSVSIIASSSPADRNGDSQYPYRQSSDFYYLTGFNEAQAIAFFIPDRAEGEYVLFCQAADPMQQRWHGHIIGQQAAVNTFAADQAFAIEDITQHIQTLLNNKQRIYYPLFDDLILGKQIKQWLAPLQTQVRRGAIIPNEFFDSNRLLHEMRLIKSNDELIAMRKAAQISVFAHQRAMQTAQVGQHEYQLQAEIEYIFRQYGCDTAYQSIVAGGERANVLHYVENDQIIEDGELVLIDAGAEYDYYAADITRTFPINGQFNQAQRAIYQLVLDTQLAVIDSIKPGATIEQLQQLTCRLLTQGLLDLGLLSGDFDQLIADAAYQRFYMHGVSHWLGMDVHDVGDYKIDGQSRPLQAGMVITVEPGLYIEKQDSSVAQQWRGIAVRIEDDVLVTDDGCEVLTAALPKTIEAIEELVAK